MRVASLTLGIIAIVGMIIGFIPCLGWFNWINIPVAIIGLVLGIIDYNDSSTPEPKQEFEPVSRISKPFPVAILLCGIALVLGSVRLLAGGGIV
ncbi:hypothetical protein [Flavobacterium psychrotrophum]|uniref:hypothetical protein n=1 Tax=Flavobacterium psychrotrophum TaxID=2294119 RepID=UPI000E31DC11|nr:hypothetical protein [Flavobacterium psychrotrophum]